MAQEVLNMKKVPEIIKKCVYYCNSPNWVSEKIIFGFYWGGESVNHIGFK